MNNLIQTTSGIKLFINTEDSPLGRGWGGFLFVLGILLLILSCKNEPQSSNKDDIDLNEQLAIEKVYFDSLLKQFPEAIYEKHDNGLLKVFIILRVDIREVPENIKHFTTLNFLGVSHTLIEELPEWLKEMQYLEHLMVHDNKISTVPQIINECRNLTGLTLSGNPIEEFKLDSVLPKLQSVSIRETPLKTFPIIPQNEDSPAINLNLSNTLIKEIPKEVGQMKISELWMSSNQLEYIAPEIGDIEELWRVELRGSPMLGGKIPETLGNCKRISAIGLNWCGLTEFPMFITELTNMRTMSLDNNLITEIPPEIGNLTQLGSFHIKYNRLTTLPKELNKLSRLRHLSLKYNNISSLPPEMFDIERETPCTLVLEGNPLLDMPVSKEKFREGYKHYGDD